jgi:acetylornithine/succinyldiaminopimelate/putrescine aminotransferase/predicted amino acid dehydrogenase
MNATPGARDDFARYVRPKLMERLRAIGLDVAYERAAGDALYFRDERGAEVEVLDFVGGFGAGLLGHNHPEMVARMRELLDAGRPFHAQASDRAPAGELGARLSARVGAATGREYVVTFASSGTEAMEAALKHAELERVQRAERILAELTDRAHEVRLRLREQTASLPDALFSAAERLLGLPHARSLDDIVAGVYRTALEAVEREPLFLGVEGAFHGKTTGSLRLTAGREYRTPWRHLGPRSVFLPRDTLPVYLRTVLRDVIAAERRTYYVLEIGEAGAVALVPRSFVNVAGCFVEPIQGEGGIRPLEPAYLRVLREQADEHGFPLVMDEIQSGMGRTGYFLASEPSGVRADYYLLSKSLGGGLAKISALLVERARYLEDFGYLHTSTFADDDHSSALALRALDIVEQDDGAVLRMCREKGAYFLEKLQALRVRYPNQLRAVRGSGLMIGIELVPPTDSASPLLRLLGEQNLLGFFICGYLLHEERIRVAPTISAHGTLRLQPSAFVSTEALDRCCAALERVLVMLRDGDAYRLSRFLTRMAESEAAGELERLLDADTPSLSYASTTGSGSENGNGPFARLSAAAGGVPGLVGAPVSVAPAADRAEDGTPAVVGFLSHFLAAEDLREWEPRLAPLSGAECERFLDRTRGVLHPFEVERVELRSAAGTAVRVVIIGIPFTPAQVAQGLRTGDVEWARELVRAGVEMARQNGCTVVGFGGYTSIITHSCQDIVASDIALTSGNSLTSAAALEALFQAAERVGVTRRHLGVVGAAGNIGRVLAEAAAPEVDEIVLVGREGTRSRLLAAAETLVARGTGRVRVATRMEALRDCSLIISATSAPRPVILPEHIGTRPVVLVDVAVPGDVDPAVALLRPNAVVLRGGTVRAPLGQHIHVPGMHLGEGGVYGCLAETALLGMAGLREHFSYGPLSAARVRRIRELARLHGFSVVESPFKTSMHTGDRS